MKGQLQTEHMIIIGVIIFASLILLYYSVQQIAATNKISKAEDAVNHLAEKVHELAVLTAGTRDSVWIDFPSGSFDIRFSGKSISLVSLERNEEHHIFTKTTVADVLGVLNATAGLQQVHVSKVNDTAVKIGNGPFLLAVIPQCIATTELSNQKTVTLLGFDFHVLLSKVYADTTLVSSATFLSPAMITIPTQALYDLIGPNKKQLTVQTPPDHLSNSVCFHIYPPGIGCGCP